MSIPRPVRDRVRHHQAARVRPAAGIKRINKVKLSRPATGEQDPWPGLAPALTRPIRWDRVAEQYDQMVKYATAPQTGTASTEAILQAALVYVNTLILQDLLAEPDWDDVLTPEDQRSLTPLFWSHVLPYGEVKLNMTSRAPAQRELTGRLSRG
jgi:TnpA family transposase